MKYSIIILIISFSILVAGCTSTYQDNNVVDKQSTFKAYEDESNRFCVITSTSDFVGKIQYNEAKNEFLMIDELFSETIPRNKNNDCYEFLLDQEGYRSMAPEFEPYLNCELKSIGEINFKKG